jgi:hypothetical protein
LEAPEGRDKLADVSDTPRSEQVVMLAASERFERSFAPSAGSVSKLTLVLGMLGGAALGAGVYAVWLAPSVPSAGWPLLLAGLVLSALGFLARPEPARVRVGELGIIVGDPAEVPRLYWHEVSALRVAGGNLQIESPRGPLSLSLSVHAQAAARILAEGASRIGSRVEVSPKAHAALPKLTDAEGERVPEARLQLAGQKCMASGVSITFEGDARLCPSCAALYHAKHVPASCLGCERPLTPAAIPAGAAERATG